MATICKLHGATIGRVAVSRIPARESETGREYFDLNGYERRNGMWVFAGTLVAFAPSYDGAKQAGCDMGLRACPFLGSPEITLDGQARGLGHARDATGYDD